MPTSTTTTTTTSAPTTTTQAPTPTVWHVTDRAGNQCYAKGVRVRHDYAGGDISVHLVDDFDVNGTMQFTVYNLEAGEECSMIFDYISTTGTTINLYGVKILL
jgi:hypothetical protein